MRRKGKIKEEKILNIAMTKIKHIYDIYKYKSQKKDIIHFIS